MKALEHARNSVSKYGGQVMDYLLIHEKLDESKKAYAKSSHRAILHSSFGIWLIQDIFGREILNSDGKLVDVRQIAEDHVLEDLGFIPTLDDWLQNLKLQPWMAGSRLKKKEPETIPEEDVYVDIPVALRKSMLESKDLKEIPYY